MEHESDGLCSDVESRQNSYTMVWHGQRYEPIGTIVLYGNAEEVGARPLDIEAVLLTDGGEKTALLGTVDIFDGEVG